MIIGITGTNAAGKGTAVDFLKEKGFKHFSVREFLRTEMARLGMPDNRESMIQLANQLREQHGPAYLIEQLYEQARANKNAVIESVRCPGEITTLRGKPNFVLLGIDADPLTRFQRANKRRSETDAKTTYKQFLETEQKEMDNQEPFKQNIKRCIEATDVLIFNNDDVRELFAKLEKNMSFDSNGYLTRRPTWDETFMYEAYTWATRSTCLRRKVGAVVATPDHVMISEGYNGSPRGTQNCVDLQVCERQRKGIPSGQKLEECLAVHAEANAIINAGRQGKSVQDAILYSTTYPCQICAPIIINSGIKKIVFDTNYDNPQAKQTLQRARVETRRFEGVRYNGFPKLFKQT